MRILYCRIGWMKSYNGINNDSIINGGSYNKYNTGHEIYNFRNHENSYYGFVQANANTINVKRIDSDIKDTLINNVLVIWLATSKELGGQRIVGWYKNATVYSSLQNLDLNNLKNRELQDKNVYNIFSKHATLVPDNERMLIINGIGQSNVWYGNDETNNKIIKYIEQYDNNISYYIDKVEHNTIFLNGYDSETLIKSRINQDKFRQNILHRFNYKCCICKQDYYQILIASHIKPWRQSDKNEKVSVYNGLLLCPNHDKLFDLGLISFNDSGLMLISKKLNKAQQILSNIDTNMKIELCEDNIPFIRYHRENIFTPY